MARRMESQPTGPARRTYSASAAAHGPRVYMCGVRPRTGVERPTACPPHRPHQWSAPRLHGSESSLPVSQLQLSKEYVRIAQARIRGSGVTVAAQVLGTCARKGVGVRVPPSAPKFRNRSEPSSEVERKRYQSGGLTPIELPQKNADRNGVVASDKNPTEGEV